MRRLVSVSVVLSALCYVVAANPDLTGIAVHEWAGVLLVAILILHLGIHIDWVIRSARRIRRSTPTGFLILDVILLFLFALVTVSGLAISRFVMPAFNLVSQGYYFWSPIHSISAKLLLAGVIVHVVLHYKWFFQLAKKLRAGIAARFTGARSLWGSQDSHAPRASQEQQGLQGLQEPAGQQGAKKRRTQE